jgi:hypothetical protein
MNDEIENDGSQELNPYFAKVIGFVDRDGQFSKDPNENQYALVINVGEVDDVKVGERVLVFTLGPELFDPENRESLGHFEVVRGEGKVTSVQTRMSVITSTRFITEQHLKPATPMAIATGVPREYETKNVQAPFRKPQLDDLVRFI